MESKRLSAAEVAEKLAAKAGLSVEQAKALLNAQAELAYSHAADGFLIPGIGLLTKSESPERRMVMRFGPKMGQEVVIPAKQRLNFRISRLVKEMVFGTSQPLPDLFKPFVMPDLKFSAEAKPLADASNFIADLGSSLAQASDGKPANLLVYQLADFSLISGHIVAADLLIGGSAPFKRAVAPGKYPLALVVAKLGTDERVAFAIIRFSDEPVAAWEAALIVGQDAAKLKEGRPPGYGVDSGTGSFCDAAVLPLIEEVKEADIGFMDLVFDEMKPSHKSTRQWVHIESAQGSIAVFSSGYGDGSYPSYFGLDSAGNPTMLVTDFGLVKWNMRDGNRKYWVGS